MEFVVKKNKTKKEIGFKYHFVFEVVFAAVFALFFILEISQKITIKMEEFPVVDIIVVLLPTIVTVISISLSLSNEKILNLKRRDFAKLLNGWYYDFLTMIIDAVVIFILYTVCKLTDAKLSTLILEGISVFYAIYYCCTEMPVLTQNDKRIIAIIKYNYYKNTQINYEFSRFEKQENLTIAISQLVFEKGIKCTYLTLKKKEHNSKLLDDLLSIQNNLLFDAVDDAPYLKTNNVSEYKNLDINLTTAIDTCFSDLEDLLSFNKDFNIEEIYGSKDKVYLMTRCLFCLHRICNTFNLKDKEKSKLYGILYRLVTISDKDDDRNKWRYSFMNSMITNTLPGGDFWFAESLRDYDYPGFIFSFDGNSAGFFYLIYCFYLTKASAFMSQQTKDKISAFVNEPSRGLNSDGVSWKAYAKRGIEMCKDDFAITFINSLMKIYTSSPDSLFYVYKRDAGFIGSNIEDNFDKRFLFNVWLEVILFNPYIRANGDLLIKTIDNFSEDDKHIFINLLSTEWIKNNELSKTNEVGFLSFIGLDVDTSLNFGNKEAIGLLCKYREKYLKDIEKQKIKEEEPNDLDKYKKLLQMYFNDGMKDNLLIDKNLSVSSEKKLYISLRLPAEGIDSIIEQYKNQLRNFFDNFIREKILEILKPTFTIKGYTLSQEEADKVIKFKPTMTSSDEYIFNGTKVKQESLSKMKKIGNGYLPRMLFIKDGGIVANFEYDDKNSQFRTLNEKEINYIIDNEFTQINGLYKYGRYGKDDINSILISREELYEFLSKTICYSVIVFKAKVKFNPKKILWIKHQSEDE